MPTDSDAQGVRMAERYISCHGVSDTAEMLHRTLTGTGQWALFQQHSDHKHLLEIGRFARAYMRTLAAYIAEQTKGGLDGQL